MKTNTQIIDFIKGMMKAEIEFTPNCFGTETWKTYCFIIRENLDHEEVIAFFDEIKKFAIEKGVMKL